MKYSKEELGKKIRTERIKLKLSQASLGKKLNVVGKQISNYENGKLFPPLEILLKLCDIFDCELGFLLGDPDFSDGTKLTTAIHNDIGLNKNTIDNLCKITGTTKTCLCFGYESEKYRMILNKLLSSSAFISFINSLYDLDQHYYYVKDGDCKIPEHKNCKEQGLDCKKLEDIIDSQRETSYCLKIDRYDVWTEFEKMMNKLYPKLRAEN